MTARDLLLVLVVAGGAGAAAAFASGVLHDDPPPAEDASAKILERLDRIENSIAASREDTKRAREATSELSERVSSLEIASRKAAESGPGEASTPTADASDVRPGRAARPKFTFSGDKPGQAAIAFGAPGEEMDGDAAIAHFLPQIETEIAGLGDELKGMTNGLKLRGLPEDKRWEQAKSDVGLSDAQVDSLKQAVTDRDASMKEAFDVEEQTGDGSEGTITIRRMDPAKAATAQSDYRKKVDDTLDENQRKSWREKGYDHAFGKHGGGGASVFVARTIEVGTPAPQPGK